MKLTKKRQWRNSAPNAAAAWKPGGKGTCRICKAQHVRLGPTGRCWDEKACNARCMPLF